MVPSSRRERNPTGHLPSYVKIVIVVQAAIILVFTIGMYQEYLNNSYLQEYVINLFRSNIVADAILSMVAVSVFAIGTLTLLGSLSTTKRLDKALEALSEQISDSAEMPAMPALETVEPPKTQRTSRRRQRKPRLEPEQIYRSMVKYSDDR